jgi:hypothetical protein
MFLFGKIFETDNLRVLGAYGERLLNWCSNTVWRRDRVQWWKTMCDETEDIDT